MLYIAGANGFEKVQESPETRDEYPIRLILITTKFGEVSAPREDTYATIEDANTDLEYLGQYFEDIALLMCEGGRPEDFGFPGGY